MKNIKYMLLALIAMMASSVRSQSDDPCDAPTLTPGTTCNFIGGTLPTSVTTTPNIPTPGCGGYNGKDIWYKVVIPATGELTIELMRVQTGSLIDMGMAWYSAATCAGPFTLIECNNDSGNDLMPKIARRNLTPGSTIWIRLWEVGGNVTGNFQICSYVSPPCTGGSNNTCATSTQICTGSSFNYCNTTMVPVPNYWNEAYHCLNYLSKNYMWFNFRVSSPGNLSILIQQRNTNGDSIGVNLALYGPFSSLTDACNNIGPYTYSLYCSNFAGGRDRETANITNAQTGQYYMMLLTNDENELGSLQFTQVGGNGAIDCNIVSPSTCSVSATMVSDTCNSGLGKVTAIPGSGLAPYTFVWNTLNNQTTETVNNVSAGIHTVTMTTSDGCTATTNVTVSNITPTASGSSTPVSCPGGNNGTATANMINPAGTVSYLWNDPAGQTTQTATGLRAGTYICTMTSSAGCTITQTVTVSEIPGMVANISSQQNPTCHNGNNGGITVTVTQGTAPYTYSWNHSGSTTNVASNLTANTHTVTIKDANGCTITKTTTLTSPTPLVMNLMTPDSTICSGNTINLSGTASGGSAPYGYSWTSNNTNIGSTQTIQANPVTSGTTYCLTITDACGTSVDSCVTISFPVPIVPLISATVASICNPIVPVTFTNQSTPANQVASTLFNFGNGLQSQVQGTADASSSYSTNQNYTVSVTVTSLAGCTYTATFPNIIQLVSATPLVFNSITTDSAVCPGNTINLSGTASGGTAPYGYSWTSNNTNIGSTQTIQTNPATSGTTYCLTITDACGTSVDDCVTISFPLPITPLISATVPSICDPIVPVTFTNQSTPANQVASTLFNFGNGLQSQVQGTADASSSYNTNQNYTVSVTVTSLAGCSYTATFPNIIQLISATPLVINSITPDSTICPGNTINLTGTASGGTAPYGYSWTSNNASSGSTQTIQATPVTSGTTYCLTITDACGASADSCITISFPVPITPLIVPGDISGCTPAVYNFINQSTPADQVAYTQFEFGNGLQAQVQGTAGTSSTYVNNQSHTVSVTVTSIFGCTYTATFPNIVQPVVFPHAAFEISPNPTTAYETNVSMQNNSGNGAIHWNWHVPGATPSNSTDENPTFHFPEGVAGNYSVQLIVENEIGCTDTAIRILVVNSDIIFYAPNAFTPNEDEHNQTWKVYGEGIDVNDFQLLIFNRWGEMIWESHNLNDGWDATYSEMPVPIGTYVWKANVKSLFSGERKEFHGSVTVLK